MNFAKIDDDFTTAPQITPEDVAEIAALGYKSIICNRPDNEQDGQPNFAAIEAAANAHNLVIIHQPIIGGTLSLSDAQAFQAIFNAAPKPVFAYCRTGTRCITLWSLAQREQGQDSEKIATAAAAHGYDVRGALANL